jgi:hypothetical protein
MKLVVRLLTERLLVRIRGASSPEYAKVSIRCGSSPRGPTISIRVDELFGDNSHKVPPSSLPCHPLTGSDIEYDGLEDPPCARTIGNAIHLVPGLPGTAGDTPPVQAASEAVLLGSLSKRHLDFFKELLPLRLGQTNDQPSEARQQSISVARLQAHSRQKIRTDHLQAVASRLVAPEH